MAGRRRRRPHIQRWAAAAALLGLLHRWRAAAAWAAAIYGVWLLLVGHLLARRAAPPFLLVMRRAHALRHRSGQRRRASVALFHLSPNWPCRSTSGSGRGRVASDSPRPRRRPRPCSGRLWTFALVGLSRQRHATLQQFVCKRRGLMHASGSA